MYQPALDVRVGSEPAFECGPVDGEAGDEGGELGAGADQKCESVVVGGKGICCEDLVVKVEGEVGGGGPGVGPDEGV